MRSFSPSSKTHQVAVVSENTTLPTEGIVISELPTLTADQAQSTEHTVVEGAGGTYSMTLGELRDWVLGELIGTIQVFPFATLPSNYLPCLGQSVAISDYPLLYAKIGILYGDNGADATQFFLPNLQDRFIRGASDSNPLAQAQDDALQNITGVVPALFDNRGQPLGAFGTGAGWNMPLNFDGDGHAGNNFTLDASRVARTADETRPKNMAFVMAIRAK